MFGTVARIQLKPGMDARMQEHVKEYEGADVSGHVATFTFKMDSTPSEYYLVAIFQDRESYVANANSPEQDGRYRRMLDLLTSEPEWHDGEIVYSDVKSNMRMG